MTPPATFCTDVITSRSSFTSSGVLFFFRSFFRASMVAFRFSAAAISILVTTTKNGTLRPSMIDRCSLVIPTMPPRLASTHIIPKSG